MNGAIWGNRKDPYYKRNYPPGMHGIKGYKKTTEYGYQLIAKQKLKKYYGEIKEKQFRRMYQMAKKRVGDTKDNLIGILESRIDVVLYRSRLAETIFLSRQLVNHKHIKINDRIINIPSYSLKPGDVMTIKKEHESKVERELPKYIEQDSKKYKFIYLRIPKLNDVVYPITMNFDLVSEFYSK